MSYTPPEQLLEDPLLKVADALSELQAPIRERLKNPHEWSKEHLQELATLLKDAADFEGRLRILASETR